jgi:hypothetical protein
MSDQRELFGLVASVPAAWRMLDEIAAGGERAQARIAKAAGAARRRAWAAIEARHGALPAVGVADKVLDGVDLPAAGCQRGGLPLTCTWPGLSPISKGSAY